MWLKILEAFRNGEFPNYYFGLTPRFIIGCCQLPIGKKFESEELARKATKRMFDEMQVFNSEGKVVVSNKCDIHKGPVMSLSTTKWTENSIGTSFEEIWQRYGAEIASGNYHINADERIIIEKIYSS
jgi:hypothetical protein